jgi:signal peptidase I
LTKPDLDKAKNLYSRFKSSRASEEIYFVLVAVLLAYGTISAAGNSLDTENPVVTVVSCSMYPHYSTGDIVFVSGKEYNEISTGDVLVFSSEAMNIPIIHRVIDKSNGTLGTRGDNAVGQNPGIGEKNISMNRIHGTAAFSIPKVGLVKLATFDILGLSQGSRALTLDSYRYNCPVNVPIEEREWLEQQN